MLPLPSMAGTERGEAGNYAFLEAPPILCLLRIQIQLPWKQYEQPKRNEWKLMAVLWSLRCSKGAALLEACERSPRSQHGAVLVLTVVPWVWRWLWTSWEGAELEQMILNRPHCTRAHLIHKLCWLKQVQISGLILWFFFFHGMTMQFSG